VRYDTEEGAGLLIGIGINEKRFGGLKFNANVKLSYSPKINLIATYSMPSFANFSIAYDYRNEHFAALLDKKSKINLHYIQHRVSGYISQFHLLNINTNIGLSYTSTSFDKSSLEGSWIDSTMFASNRLLTPFVNFEYDNLDDAYFAKQGISARLTGRYHIDMSKLDSPYSWIKTNCWDISYSFQAYITPRKGRFTIIPQIHGRWIFNSPMYFNLWNVYGSEIEGRHFENQMPFIGFGTVESTDDNVSILRADLRYNFYGKHYLTAMYNVLLDWSAIPLLNTEIKANPLEAQGAGIKYSYNSPVGPISLTGYWSRRDLEDHFDNYFGVYFSFGYTF
jgi:hypothetical protein